MQSSKFHLPSPPSTGQRPDAKDVCRRCGEPFRADVEICPSCGKWRHGMTLILAGIVAIVVSMLAAWFVFANTF